MELEKQVKRQAIKIESIHRLRELDREAIISLQDRVLELEMRLEGVGK